MDTTATDAPLTGQTDETSPSGNALAEEITERCVRLIAQLNRFKQPRLDRIQMYRDLYAGKTKKKFRQTFNVTLPVFSGIMDTLMADFNDDLSLEFEPHEPADYIAVTKLNSLWQMENNSSAPNAKFALKARQDRSNALFSGRGFMMNYAISDPKYQNNFEIYELEDAIFQPRGGAQLEKHLYNGRQNVIRSDADLKSPIYDQKQVKRLLEIAAKTDFYPADDIESRTALGKYQAMGLSTTNADYVGEQLFRLVEMRITVKGEKYYIVFSPWYKTWVRFDKFSNVFSANIDPWISWATHEDNKNFMSKSYADDLYGVADSIHTLFNQELTNREKRNFHGRAFDKEMFPDVGALDKINTRPDALVPADTKGGTRRISEGIYTFDTAELNGTINLIQFIKSDTGTDIGVTPTSMGASGGVSKRASVMFAEQQALAKRLLLRQSSYTEAMSEIGRLFFQAAKDHLPASMAIRRLGIEGQGWDAVIKRTELDLYGDFDVEVKSSAIEMKNSQLKKEARSNILEAITNNPTLVTQINPRWTIEELLRSGGEYDDREIKLALDTKNYGNKEEVAYAHQAIQQILNNEKPDMFYGATTLYMQILVDFASNNRNTLGPKYDAIIQHAMAHKVLVQENMLRKAAIDAAAMPPLDPNAAAPAAPGAANAPSAPGGAIPAAPATPPAPVAPPTPALNAMRSAGPSKI